MVGQMVEFNRKQPAKIASDVAESPAADSERNQALKVVGKKALDLLSRREHTVQELKQKLTVRGFESDIVLSVLDDLVDRDYLSDLRYAEAFVRTRLKKGYGERSIRATLSEKGVAQDVALQVLTGQNIDWTALAFQALQKKHRGSGTGSEEVISSQSLRARYARHLQSRGFTSEQTIAALEQLSAESAERQRER